MWKKKNILSCIKFYKKPAIKFYKKVKIRPNIPKTLFKVQAFLAGLKFDFD